VATPRLSIIVCTNSEKTAKRYVLTGEDDMMSRGIELILLKNEANSKFKSIAEAYNYGASEAKSELLMFVHHDVVFNNILELESLISYCDGREFGIIGSCGISENRLFYSDRNVTWNNKELSFTSPLFADAVDEPVFVVKRSTWQKEPFDEKVIDGFHLCATEYSLRMKLLGESVILFPIDISHFNIGSKDMDVLSSTIKKRNHMCAWIQTAVKLQFKYSDQNIKSMQGPITGTLILIYSVYYRLILRMFPVLGYKFTSFLSSDPTFSRVINSFLRKFKY